MSIFILTLEHRLDYRETVECYLGSNLEKQPQLGIRRSIQQLHCPARLCFLEAFILTPSFNFCALLIISESSKSQKPQARNYSAQLSPTLGNWNFAACVWALDRCLYCCTACRPSEKNLQIRMH